MQLSIVNNKRMEAFKGGKGICPLCGGGTIAKCGPRIIHHWAHQNIKECDPWWENETLWHRNWKNNFPIESREVCHKADDGEIHRADIKTTTGIIIEFQHSPITDKERESRETFYKNLVWVIDGKEFENNFDIYHKLPNPKSELELDLRWFKAMRNRLGSNDGMFYRISEAQKLYPDAVDYSMVEVHSIRKIQEEVDKNYNGYHQYDWIKPRKTWLEASCPVYIDFGNEFLYKLETYDNSGLACVRIISKLKFMYDVMHEKKADNIATSFPKIGEWVKQQNFSF